MKKILAILAIIIVIFTAALFLAPRDNAGSLHEKRAVHALRKLAEKNDSEAQYYLGLIELETGEDAKTALAWWQKASDNGYGPASHALGRLYENPPESRNNLPIVAENIPLAREYWQKALDQGQGFSAFMLYHLDRVNGQYYNQVIEKEGKASALALASAAQKWLEKGVLLKDGKVLEQLMHHHGCYASPLDFEKLLPAVQGMESSDGKSAFLGLYHFDRGDYAQAVQYLEKISPESGALSRLPGAYWLGRIYEEGLSVPRDESKARKAYRTAGILQTPHSSCQDKRLARWHLAIMAAQGRGGEVDKNLARDLLHKLEAPGEPNELEPLQMPSAEQMEALRAAIAAP